MSESPIGVMLVKMGEKASKAKSRSASMTAPCGCEVEVAYLGDSTTSTRNRVDRCAEHALDPNRFNIRTQISVNKTGR